LLVSLVQAGTAGNSLEDRVLLPVVLSHPVEFINGHRRKISSKIPKNFYLRAMTLPAKHFLAAAIWIALSAAVYWIVDSQTAPKVATAATGGAIVIPRSMDGHFYVAGALDGQRVDFLIDTGASTTSVSAEIARQIGLPPGRPVTLHTANGITQGAATQVRTLVLGGITLQHVNIVVLPHLSGHALLGQNVLRHLEVSQSADRMVIGTVAPKL
jgi:aspartyl protease family protein